MIQKILYPSRDPSWNVIIASIAIALMIWISFTLFEPVLANEGLALHAENCVACHSAMTGGDGSVLYTREDRVVGSLDALNKQVHRCQSSLGLSWSSEQISTVQQYLNATFYKF